jgi:hypothetical protein
MRTEPRTASVCALVFAFAAACATEHSARDDERRETASADGRDARVLATTDLPPRQRAVWESWQRGGPRWELEREEVRKDPELAQFLVDNLVRTLVKSYDRSALATVGKASGPFERAAAELAEFSAQSTPVLVELVGVRDGIVAFLAADLLVRIGAPAAAPVSRLLTDAHEETRRRAAELLGKLAHAGADEARIQQALAVCVEHDSAWITRAEAARSLGLRGSRHEHKGFALGVLARALADADETVVTSACEGLVRLGERRAVPALARALQPTAERGAVKALAAEQAALRALTGLDKNRTPEGWLEWYAQHPPPPLKALEPAR